MNVVNLLPRKRWPDSIYNAPDGMTAEAIAHYCPDFDIEKVRHMQGAYRARVDEMEGPAWRMPAPLAGEIPCQQFGRSRVTPKSWVIETLFTVKS